MKNYPGQRRSPAWTPLPATAARASVPRPARGLCAHALPARSLALGLPRSRPRGARHCRCPPIGLSVPPSPSSASLLFPRSLWGPSRSPSSPHCSGNLPGFPSPFPYLCFCCVLLSLSPLCISPPLFLCSWLCLVSAFAAFVPIAPTLSATFKFVFVCSCVSPSHPSSPYWHLCPSMAGAF